jgi:signal transduction histidine kinase
MCADPPDSVYTYPEWTRLTWAGFSLAVALMVGLRLRQQQQLKASLEAQAKAELAQSMQQERQRVMRDMHDGLGAHLSALLSLTGQPQPDMTSIQHQVRLAIDELRQTVNASQTFDGNLCTMLGELRTRLERHLAFARIKLDWHVEFLPDTIELSPLQVQHVQRILLEATNNAAKHSGASKVSLHASYDSGEVVLLLRDNGHGFDINKPRSGNGLKNMQWRAKALGGALSVKSGTSSTTVKLVVPVAV